MVSFSFAAQQTISLETKDSQMVFCLNESGEAERTHYGAKLRCLEDLAQGAGTRSLLYPTFWDALCGESCVVMSQGDGQFSLDLKYRSHSLSSEKGQEQLLSVVLSDDQYPIEVTVFILAHWDSNVFEQWVELNNKGTESVILHKIASGHLQVKADRYFVTSFRGVWAAESLMEEAELKRGNTLEIAAHTGTNTAQMGTPGFVLSLGAPAQEDVGEVYLGALAWSGNYLLRFENNPQNQLMANFGVSASPWQYVLDGGKSLVLPRLILTHSLEGKGLASRQLHRWARAGGVRDGEKLRRTLLNSWEGTYFTFDEPLLAEMMEKVAGIGVELFVLDDGWFGNKHPRNHDRAGLGDWQVNKAKLPHGIEGLTQTATAKGIDFGLWVEPEMVNPKSELFEKHPDWVIQLPHRDRREQRNQLILDLSNPEVQDFIFNTVDSLLSENKGISYVKWDCNRRISDPGSPFLENDRQGNLPMDYVFGYYKVLEKLTEKHPEVTFQACSAGGGRADYGAMKYHHEFWVSDNTDPYDRIFMQWSVGHLFPANTMASHVTATGRTASLKFRFDVAMTGRLGFELQPKNMGEADIAFSRKALAEYKRIRSVVQQGDLYRLRSPFEGQDAALMYIYEEAGKQHVLVFAYRLEKKQNDQMQALKLKGLHPESRYAVKEINLEGDASSFGLHGKSVGGDYLMQQGVSLPLERRMQSCVIELIEK